jgi:DNA sulfur modification protein DndB
LYHYPRLGEIIPEWRLAIKRQVSGADLRTQYVHSHGVALHALGIAGRTLLTTYPETWAERLALLERLDWRRTHTSLWEGRAMHHGKMSKAWINVRLTANTLKQLLELPLTDEEHRFEIQANDPLHEREMA